MRPRKRRAAVRSREWRLRSPSSSSVHSDGACFSRRVTGSSFEGACGRSLVAPDASATACNTSSAAIASSSARALRPFTNSHEYETVAVADCQATWTRWAPRLGSCRCQARRRSDRVERARIGVRQSAGPLESRHCHRPRGWLATRLIELTTEPFRECSRGVGHARLEHGRRRTRDAEQVGNRLAAAAGERHDAAAARSVNSLNELVWIRWLARHCHPCVSPGASLQSNNLRPPAHPPTLLFRNIWLPRCFQQAARLTVCWANSSMKSGECANRRMPAR